MNKPRMNESVNCSGQQTQNGRTKWSNTVMWRMSCEWFRNTWSIVVYFEPHCTKTEREKRTNGPSLRKEQGTNVVYWLVMKSIQHFCSSLHSRLCQNINPLSVFMQHLATAAHLEHMSGCYTFRSTLELNQTHPHTQSLRSVLDLLSKNGGES